MSDKAVPFYFGSLFAGIGGIDLGLERAGMECLWQVENNAFCVKVLEKHWPDVRRYGDARKADPKKIEGECGKVRLVAGGFPCQDLSFSGKRRGIHAERSGLWFEFERFVRDLRPEVVLVENVPGLLSGGLEVVLGCLAALGYDAEWDCIPAAIFGAPHLRHRVFIVAYHDNRKCAGGGNKGGKEMVSYIEKDSRGLGNVLDEVEEGGKRKRCICSAFDDPDISGGRDGGERLVFDGCRFRENGQGEVWPVEAEPRMVRVAYGVSKGMDEDWEREIHFYQKRKKRMVDDRVMALGNAVVPQVAEWIGRRIMGAFGWC